MNFMLLLKRASLLCERAVFFSFSLTLVGVVFNGKQSQRIFGAQSCIANGDRSQRMGWKIDYAMIMVGMALRR